MKKTKTIAGLAAGAVLAGACLSSTSYWDAGGSLESGRGAFRYAGADRDFRTRVVGNPFAVPQAETERAVIAAMQGRDRGMNTNFTTTPRNAYMAYHIVMLFNPTRTGSAACAAPERHTGPARPGALSLAALFCNGDRLVYGIGSTVSGVTAPDDPLFDSFVNNLMYQFVPYESMVDDDPDNDDD